MGDAARMCCWYLGRPQSSYIAVIDEWSGELFDCLSDDCEGGRELDDTLTPTMSLVGEYRMWASVLMLGLADAARGKRNAVNWLGSDDFVYVCELLHLDPAFIRSSLTNARVVSRLTSRGPSKRFVGCS